MSIGCQLCGAILGYSAEEIAAAYDNGLGGATVAEEIRGGDLAEVAKLEPPSSCDCTGKCVNCAAEVAELLGKLRRDGHTRESALLAQVARDTHRDRN